MLATFDAEDAAFRDGTEGGMAPADRFKLEQRIGDLERLLQEYKAANNALQTRVDELLADAGGLSGDRRNGGDSMVDVDTAVREERYARDRLESGVSSTSRLSIHSSCYNHGQSRHYGFHSFQILHRHPPRSATLKNR